MSDSQNFPYLHGFSKEEQDRLRDQARFFEFEIFKDIDFRKVDKLLEIGCGVGAQTEILLRRFPEINITGIDLNQKQIDAAVSYFQDKEDTKNRFNVHNMSAEKLEFKDNEFDAIFICWVLEHLPSPEKALKEAKRVLKPGGKIFVTEVMNSSFFLDPYSPNVWKYWVEFNDYQYENAGDPFIGAKLGNLLCDAGFSDINTSTKTLHYDNRQAEKRKETIVYWKNLLLSASDELVSSNHVTEEQITLVKKEFDQVIENDQAIFYYSFMQACALA